MLRWLQKTASITRHTGPTGVRGGACDMPCRTDRNHEGTTAGLPGKVADTGVSASSDAAAMHLPGPPVARAIRLWMLRISVPPWDVTSRAVRTDSWTMP